MISCIKRAWKDTLRGQVVALFIVVAGGCLSLVYLYLQQGRDVALDEVAYVQAAIFGAVGALALLFLWNLMCAPYRIQRDGRLAAEAKVAELQAAAPKPQKRHLSIEQQGLLASFLRTCGVKPNKMNVVHYESEEANDFAVDLGDAIASAGIECSVHSGGWFTKPPKDRGLKLYRSKDKIMVKLASDLNETLTGLGYPCEIRVTDDPNNIFFFVARNSEP